MSEAAPILEMRGISKTFGAVRALRGVDLTVWPGEIHALMGENGAGKSTLMKILSGAYHADPGGRMLVDGREVAIVSPLDALRLGVAVIYQELSLAPNLSVQQNVCLGREAARAGILDKATMRRQCADILKRLGADFRPETRVSRLSLAQQQMVEIARALSVDARILVMDEPTASLSSRETDKLFDLIRTLRADGLAIIYISHRMAEVYELADRCSVLRDGGYVGTLKREELSEARLIQMMVGRDLSDFYKKDKREGRSFGGSVLEVEGLADGCRIGPASFDVRAGEVVGLAGLVGAGRTELARMIFGAEPARKGRILLEGKPLVARHPSEAIAAGIVYLSEDRKGLGLFFDMSIEDNVNLAVAAQDAHPLGIRRLALAARRGAEALRSLSIRAKSAQSTVRSLSGGNQQKVLFARLLATAPKLLILDEPTRGVDIGAKSDIYKLIDKLAESGAAILIISSELPEVIGIADRVFVMRDGRIAGVLAGADITQERVMAIATANNDKTGGEV
ncbi:Arabinose import ATP-binding protein AraG [Pleomorphomonas sp. T1.2MG-36]|uniref:sugar ABC transporter ATP-binding protein n=1 Tax=Pleomorphomonas sp. T1.2MG-36 TaxID=3041167 RepID=UPI00247734CA|nr:sugar ABC transporter ATP-binding protein [Pleomorphomonas sp. T1.2MG-36]CAI9416600.1 Arabinose import ATP-binding protein AraG [Pleomorphomonas sp. T1.2MG-36]